MNKNDQQFIAQKIRAQYTEKQASEVDELRKLDAKVKRPANMFAYIFGVVSAIIMGTGMSLIMTDIVKKIGFTFDPILPGVVIGVVGMLMALINYPIYKAILGSRKKKYGAEIFRLSNKILNK